MYITFLFSEIIIHNCKILQVDNNRQSKKILAFFNIIRKSIRYNTGPKQEKSLLPTSSLTVGCGTASHHANLSGGNLSIVEESLIEVLWLFELLWTRQHVFTPQPAYLLSSMRSMFTPSLKGCMIAKPQIEDKSELLYCTAFFKCCILLLSSIEILFTYAEQHCPFSCLSRIGTERTSTYMSIEETRAAEEEFKTCSL